MTLYKVCVALLWGASLQVGLGDWGEVPEGSVRFRKVPAPPQALPSLSAPWGASGAPAEERALWASGCGVLWMPGMDPLAALQRRWWLWWGEEEKERPWGAGHNRHFQPCAAGGGAGNEGVKSNLGRRGVVEVFSVSCLFFSFYYPVLSQLAIMYFSPHEICCVCDSDWWVFSLTFPWPWSFSIIFSSFPAGGSGLNKPWLTRCGTTTGRFPVTMLMLMIASGTSDCLTAPMPVWGQTGAVSCSYLTEVSRSLPILVISVSGVLPLYHS